MQSVTSPDGEMVSCSTILPCRSARSRMRTGVQRVDRALVAIEHQFDLFLAARGLAAVANAGGAVLRGAGGDARADTHRRVIRERAGARSKAAARVARTRCRPSRLPTLEVISERSERASLLDRRAELLVPQALVSTWSRRSASSSLMARIAAVFSIFLRVSTGLGCAAPAPPWAFPSSADGLGGGGLGRSSSMRRARRGGTSSGRGFALGQLDEGQHQSEQEHQAQPERHEAAETPLVLRIDLPGQLEAAVVLR